MCVGAWGVEFAEGVCHESRVRRACVRACVCPSVETELRLSFVHGYNGGPPTWGRSAAETARKCVPISPAECSEPDELGYATVGRKVAGSSPDWR